MFLIYTYIMGGREMFVIKANKKFIEKAKGIYAYIIVMIFGAFFFDWLAILGIIKKLRL